jgi:hypothetical protein
LTQTAHEVNVPEPVVLVMLSVRVVPKYDVTVPVIVFAVELS